MLKFLSNYLNDIFLGKYLTLLIIISTNLDENHVNKLMSNVLKEHKRILSWIIIDIRVISPSICLHKILMEENYRYFVNNQRKLSLIMKEEVKKKF